MFGIGIFMLYCLILVFLNHLKPQRDPAAAGLVVHVLCRMNIGNFLSSYWNGLIFQIFGPSFVTPYIVAAAAFIVLGLIWAAFNTRNPSWIQQSSPQLNIS